MSNIRFVVVEDSPSVKFLVKNKIVSAVRIDKSCFVMARYGVNKSTLKKLVGKMRRGE